jgi:hypothetical protein
MKKILLSLMAVSALHLAVSAQTKSLFDGKTTKGWHTYLKTDAKPGKLLTALYSLIPKREGQGDLVTDGEYENYELTLEWNIEKGGNSGIIFGVHEDPKFGATYQTGMKCRYWIIKMPKTIKKPTTLQAHYMT